MTAEELIAAQRLIRRLPVGERVVEGILTWCARAAEDTGR